jgi:hypothetical protein
MIIEVNLEGRNGPKARLRVRWEVSVSEDRALAIFNALDSALSKFGASPTIEFLFPDERSVKTTEPITQRIYQVGRGLE